jgi:hypothetical protein
MEFSSPTPELGMSKGSRELRSVVSGIVGGVEDYTVLASARTQTGLKGPEILRTTFYVEVMESNIKSYVIKLRI